MSGWISSKLKVAESLLQQIDQQAAESLRKNNEASASTSASGDDHLNQVTKHSGDIIHLPPLKDQLLKKNKKQPPPEPDKKKKNKTSSVYNNNNEDKVIVNPKSTLSTDAVDWTQLLSTPTRINNNGTGGALPRASRQVRSGSNLLALDTKQRSQAKSARRRSDVDKVTSQRLDGNRGFESTTQQAAAAVDGVAAENLSSETDAVTNANDEKVKNLNDGNSSDYVTDLNLNVKNEQIVSNSSSGVEMTRLSNKIEESLSASDDGTETDSDSTSDSESEREREREERRKRREQLLAQKAAAKAIEAIKDRENLVARLEGEKQSLEKIIDERAKQQAHEASQLQMTMMETMEAVDLEKQKHNSTRMEILMKLAKLETTNAELAKSLAAAQWNLEVEAKRVAELHRQIELKEASHEELASKKESRLSGTKLTTTRGVEFEHEILEAEHAFVMDKVVQLQEKAKTLDMTIQVTRKEIQNPTEVEVELKHRLTQLTDHLIQKQAQVEALSSEKAMLTFKIEAVSRSLDESNSSLKTSKMNDVESGVRWEVRLQERVEKGQKQIIGSMVRQLDSIFLTAAAFLRRNPMGKILSAVYLVCLHLWVLYIFRSNTIASNEGSRSGAVISLDNINNTGA